MNTKNEFKVVEKPVKQKKVYTLNKDSKIALTATFLKCLSEQKDLQVLLSELNFVVKKSEICVINPPASVSIGEQGSE